jgi:thermitase
MTSIPPNDDSGRQPFMIQPGDYPDPRDEAEKAEDEEIVRRQLGVLSSDDRATQLRIREIIGQLQQEEDEKGLLDATPFDLWETGDTKNSFVLAARGRIVVESGAASLLPIEGYELVQPTASADFVKRVPRGASERIRQGSSTSIPRGSSVYMSVSAKTVGELAADAQRLQEVYGVPASLDYVVPLGHVVKGDDFPEPASTHPCGYPPEQLQPPPSGTGTPVRIAVIDTGITGELRLDGWLNDILRGPADIDQVDIVAPLNRLDWFAGHGSFTAGVVQQVAPFTEVIAYRFTGPNGIGTEGDIADAILRAAGQAAQDGVHLVINLSVGTPAVNGLPPLALRNAVEFVHTNYPDVVMVASAGNNGTDEPMYPAAFPEVVGVGALTADLKPADFSSFGPWVTCSCVGVGVVSTFVPGILPPEPIPGRDDISFGPDAFAVWSGTSFSAPQISGAIARLCEMNDWAPPVALAALLANQNVLNDFGYIIDELLPGTPV